MMLTDRDAIRAARFEISELTRQIKGVLEGSFGSVWVEGEISNLHGPRRGMCISR